MTVHSPSAQPDALHRILAATWRAIVTAVRAVARLVVAAARWLRGEAAEEEKHLTRAERKRLRKQKLRQLQAARKSPTT